MTTKELSARLDRLIQFETGGWRVRKEADLVDSENRVTGSKYSTERAPGAGAFAKRNLGKAILTPGYAFIGSSVGHGVFPHVKGATAIGTGIGAVAGLATGNVLDRTRKRLALGRELQPRFFQDYLQARGIHERRAQ